MEDKIKTQNKIKRKKFFTSLSLSLLGATVLNKFPFNFFNSSTSAGDAKGGSSKAKAEFKLQANQFAVNRKKTGGKNV